MTCFLKLVHGKVWALPLPFDRTIEVTAEKLSAHIPGVLSLDSSFRDFTISNDNGEWSVSATGEPVLVDGVASTRCVLADGCSIVSGLLDFEVRLHFRWKSFPAFRDAIANDGHGFLAGRSPLSAYVEDHVGALFAIVDAAASDDVPRYLADPRSRMVSLLQGRAAREHFLEAPYLAPLSGGSQFAKDFLGPGIEECWGVIINPSGGTTQELLSTLRSNLWAKLNNEALFFRFYDPGVASRWVVTLDAEGRADFLGDQIEEFIFQHDGKITCVGRNSCITDLAVS